jgi:hypothetical protein
MSAAPQTFVISERAGRSLHGGHSRTHLRYAQGTVS